MNGNSMTIHQKSSSSKKTEGWIYLNYLYEQTVSSNLVQAAGHTKIGITFLADLTKINHSIKFTTLSLRDTPEVELSGNDYAPAESGTVYFEQDILRYPDSKNRISGTMYFDIPDSLEEFYILLCTVNVDFYIEEMWLE